MIFLNDKIYIEIFVLESQILRLSERMEIVMDNTENKTRIPKQKRSIEKREKIIEAGFNLICEQGFHSTNTAQIAKAAGVSTGIVYQYFNDKHDIFMEGMKKYSSNIFYPMIDIVDVDIRAVGLKTIVKNIIDKFLERHKMSEEAHEKIMSMIHSDHEVAEIFHESEYAMTEKMVDILIKNGYQKDDLAERVHLCIGIVDNLCHDMLYHNHGTIDYDVMSGIVIDNICYLLEN